MGQPVPEAAPAAGCAVHLVPANVRARRAGNRPGWGIKKIRHLSVNVAHVKPRIRIGAMPVTGGPVRMVFQAVQNAHRRGLARTAQPHWINAIQHQAKILREIMNLSPCVTINRDKAFI